jgi:spore photoproduct lyase
MLNSHVEQLHQLDIETIYYEPEAVDYARGREILARYADARLIEVPSHWQIEGLHGNEGAVEDWIKIKRSVLVLGVKKSIQAEPYDRNADFTAPSHANGCAMACAYCYVPRRKGFANPITTFVNIERILKYLERHAARQGSKSQPTMADPTYWTYEIGSNSDCSVDAVISENVHDLIALFRRLPNAKATFATKFVNRAMLDYDPQGKTRIRFSLMPPRISKLVDVRTSRIEDRILAINDFVDAGYEVNINFAPFIYYDGWRADYVDLFRSIDDALSPAAKAQLQAEVVFLTHHEGLHEVNLLWHPVAEELLWKPDLQETKYSGTGGKNLRYKLSFKQPLVQEFRDLLNEHLPYCRIRYAF